MNLYDVTTKRVYTEEHKAKWPSSRDYETTYTYWGESIDEVIAKIEDNIRPGRYATFDKMYRDHFVSAILVSKEDLQARRDVLANSRYAKGCCDKAILRNCVCSYSTTCPDHGVRCHGSHD